MNENRLPPGYVPLTIHELSAQTLKQGSASRRSEGGGDRSRRNGKQGGPSRGGRMNNNKRRPRPEENEPVEE